MFGVRSIRIDDRSTIGSRASRVACRVLDRKQGTALTSSAALRLTKVPSALPGGGQP